jgi:hypothetical protein
MVFRRTNLINMRAGQFVGLYVLNPESERAASHLEKWARVIVLGCVSAQGVSMGHRAWCQAWLPHGSSSKSQHKLRAA